MKRWPVWVRGHMLHFFIGSIVFIVLVFIVWWQHAESEGLSQTDFFALMTLGATMAALMLAGVAAVVATLAYAAAIQRPTLEPVIRFLGGEENAPNLSVQISSPGRGESFVASRKPERPYLIGSGQPGTPLKAAIGVRNPSATSAHNVAVRIDIVGVDGTFSTAGRWKERPADKPHTRRLEWECGADDAVHGQWTRDLDELDFTNALPLVDPDVTLELQIEIVADGFFCRKSFPLLEKDSRR